MSQSIVREPTGDVVARITPTYAIRFKKNAGGAPMEFWYDGLPLLTDPMLGEGCQITYDTGQDSTQASAEGLTGFPVDGAILKDEIDTAQLSYTVQGSCPFFWLSHEQIDDRNPGGPSAFITKYNSRPAPNHWLGGASIGFAPLDGIKESIISPRDTLYSDFTFKGDIAKIEKGLGTARTYVYMGRTNDPVAKAGIVFRGTPIAGIGADHADVVSMPHYKFVINKTTWFVQERDGVIASGMLTNGQRAKLINNSQGLKLEVRSSVENPTLVQFFIDGSLTYFAHFPSNKDCEWFGIYAKCGTGRIDFDRREFMDMSLEFKAVSKIVSEHLTIDVSIKSLLNEPFKLNRANYVFFLNRQTFLNNRSTQILKRGETTWADFDGVIEARQVDALFAGAVSGNAGIKVVPLSASNDGVDAVENGFFHFLLSKHQINDSFVLHSNSIPFNSPQSIVESKFKIAVFNRRDT